jgi:DnaJ-class molecular chaperone
MDYYSILGINKQANQDEIKKAYRKQAMAHHPDHGGDSGKFAQINEAYETLKDPNKRQEYDNPQVRMNVNSSNLDDIMNAFFGQRQQRPQVNRDIKISITIDLEDVAVGRDVLATYKLSNGMESSASIKIQPGIEHGQALRFRGLGDATDPRRPRGDLIVLVKIRPHTRFKRDGKNLYTNIKISVFDLMLGTDVIVEKIGGGPLRVNIPKGTQPSQVLSVAGYGLPDPRTGRTGHMYVNIHGVLPKIDDPEMERRIKILNDELSTRT